VIAIRCHRASGSCAASGTGCREHRPLGRPPDRSRGRSAIRTGHRARDHVGGERSGDRVSMDPTSDPKAPSRAETLRHEMATSVQQVIRDKAFRDRSGCSGTRQRFRDRPFDCSGTSTRDLCRIIERAAELQPMRTHNPGGAFRRGCIWRMVRVDGAAPNLPSLPSGALDFATWADAPKCIR
jgi:hypothetical protein